MDITLFGKIAKASIEVGGKLETDKRFGDKMQGYDYISADKILAVAGQALAEQGVIVFPAITKEEIAPTPTANNKTRWDARVEFVMTVIADGEKNQFEVPWVGRGSDYSVPDKALYKAVTSGHKYFLAKLLNIGAGNEDGEHEPAQEQAQTQPVQSKATNGKPAQPVQAPALTPADVRNRAVVYAMTKKNGAYNAQKHAEATYDKLYNSHPDMSLADISKMWVEVTEAHILYGLLGEKKTPESMYKLDLAGLQALVAELKQRVRDVDDHPFDDADAEAEMAVAEARAEA